MLSLLRISETLHVSKLVAKRSLVANSKLNVSSYKAVIFDMGGVILPSPFNVAYKWEKNHGLEQGTIFKAIKHNKNQSSWSKLERGELFLEQFYSPFAQEVSSLLPKEKSISADMIQDFMTNLSNALAKVRTSYSLINFFE